MTWKILLVVGGLLTALPAAAQLTQERATVSAGGGTLTSSQYTLTGTIGQASPVGVLSNATLTIQAGFWHGATPMAFTLTIKKRGTGSGVVTGPGIACGADCAERYAAGTTLDLAAAPDPCSRFVRWEDAAGQPLLSPLTVSANLTVAAVFEACCPAPVTLLSPVDSAANQPLDVTLTWQAAAKADSYDVFLGASEPLAKQTTTLGLQYAPVGLTLNTTYAWRVDAVNRCGATPGTARSFTTIAQTDVVPPVITLHVTPETIILGQSVTITTSATDNIGVTDFHLTVNGTEIATTPGTATYTPSAAGTSSVAASAKDAAGNSEAETMFFWVTGATATIPLYEGFDAEHGISDVDATVVTFTSGSMIVTDSIPYPPGMTQLFTFHEATDLHFEAANGLRLFLEPGVKGILLKDTRYDSVTADSLAGLTLGTWAGGTAISATDTVVFLTAEGRYFKFAYVAMNAAAWTVEAQYAELAQ